MTRIVLLLQRFSILILASTILVSIAITSISGVILMILIMILSQIQACLGHTACSWPPGSDRMPIPTIIELPTQKAAGSVAGICLYRLDICKSTHIYIYTHAHFRHFYYIHIQYWHVYTHIHIHIHMHMHFHIQIHIITCTYVYIHRYIQQYMPGDIDT